ncbi:MULTISPECIES: hypothetical protein [Niastella]|uniref:Anti-sigma factor n=1 Tax=Niastella soli TaxID=2821487 RepID=A0ABS3YNE4_9BACT|nr:hypothetical protein [Niastella soli]MBO9199410.1 hypothetical protein [Niastella soli]
MRPTLSMTLRLCLLSLVTFFYLTSYSQKKTVRFVTSTVVPEAEGSVKVRKDKNKNYEIDIHVDHLADPKKLTPSKKTYVVWIETKESGPKNIGQLHTGSSMLSKAKKADISSVSTYKPSRVFITAEDNPAIESPGTQVVLTTDTF